HLTRTPNGPGDVETRIQNAKRKTQKEAVFHVSRLTFSIQALVFSGLLGVSDACRVYLVQEMPVPFVGSASGYRRFVTIVLTWLGVVLTAGGMQAGGGFQDPPNTPGRTSSFGPSAANTTSAQQAVFQKYCLTCHNQNLRDRGTVPIAFDKLDL